VGAGLNQYQVDESAWEELDSVWADRIEVILEDIRAIDGLSTCTLYSEDGTPVAHYPGTGSGTLAGEGSALTLPHAQKVLKEVLDTFGTLAEELPHYMVQQQGDDLLLLGFAAGLVIAARFDSSPTTGAIVMRFAKRVRHLRSLQKTRDRGALYI